jgi:hypothetical protein
MDGLSKIWRRYREKVGSVDHRYLLLDSCSGPYGDTLFQNPAVHGDVAWVDWVLLPVVSPAEERS